MDELNIVGVKDRTKEPVKFAGQVVELQNMKVIMPPLNFVAFRRKGAAKKLDQIIQSTQNISADGGFDIPDEVFDNVVELTHMAISRNYPDITLDEIEEGLDFDNMQGIIQKLMVQSNLAKLEKFQQDFLAKTQKHEEILQFPGVDQE